MYKMVYKIFRLIPNVASRVLKKIDSFTFPVWLKNEINELILYTFFIHLHTSVYCRFIDKCPSYCIWIELLFEVIFNLNNNFFKGRQRRSGPNCIAEFERTTERYPIFQQRQSRCLQWLETILRTCFGEGK